MISTGTRVTETQSGILLADIETTTFVELLQIFNIKQSLKQEIKAAWYGASMPTCI